ncbi:hypothetical protein [Shimia sediminis]|uniref:hypothetical protein n=1 Tax=Shimia sediminis TaxID=2497945 RepID=UPI000F8D88F3|nr:hypothetical protein [Shimia sediminis]
MLTFFWIALAGFGTMALVDILDDDSDAPNEDPCEDSCEEDYADWPGDDLRVTPDGGDASFVDAPGGTDADELIETNITDDVYQGVDAGDGLDEVIMGLGDNVDTLSDDPTADHGDDVAGEEGDHVIVRLCCDDLAGAAQLGTEYSDTLDTYRVQEIEGEIPVFEATMGSADTLEIQIPDSADGAVFAVEGTDTYISGSGSLGPELENDYAYVLYSETGSIPDGLRTDEGSIWYDTSFGPLEENALDGIYVIGLVDLGDSYYAYNPDTDETTTWDRTIDLPSITLTQPAAPAAIA